MQVANPVIFWGFPSVPTRCVSSDADPEHTQISVFDRSWYGRVLVERVEGLAKPAEWKRAFGEINDFEEMFARTSTNAAPWHVVASNDKSGARATVLGILAQRLAAGLDYDEATGTRKADPLDDGGHRSPVAHEIGSAAARHCSWLVQASRSAPRPY